MVILLITLAEFLTDLIKNKVMKKYFWCFVGTSKKCITLAGSKSISLTAHVARHLSGHFLCPKNKAADYCKSEMDLSPGMDFDDSNSAAVVLVENVKIISQ